MNLFVLLVDAVIKRKSLPPGFCELIGWKEERHKGSSPLSTAVTNGKHVIKSRKSVNGCVNCSLGNDDYGGSDVNCDEQRGLADSSCSVNTVQDPVGLSTRCEAKLGNGFASGTSNILDSA